MTKPQNKKALHIRFDSEESRAKFFDDIPEKWNKEIEFLADDCFSDLFLSDWKFDYLWAKHKWASIRYSFKKINAFSPTISEKAELMEVRGISKQVWEKPKKEKN